MSARLDQIMFTLLLVLCVFTALAHGTVEPWSVAIFEWACVLLLFLNGLKATLERRITLPCPAVLWPLLAVLVLGFLQSFSWMNAAGQRQSLSFDVEATRATVLQFFLLVVAFLTAAIVLAQRERLELWQRFVVCFGGVLALFALVQHFWWDGKFFWLRPAVAEDITSPFGPFVHHGHYAGYMELLLPLPLALLIVREVTGAARLVYYAASLMMLLSALLSLSRGGALGLMFELIFLAVAGTQVARRFSHRRFSRDHAFDGEFEEGFAFHSHAFIRAVLSRLGIIGFSCVILVVGLWWIGAEPILNRLVSQSALEAQGTSFYATRGWIWRDTLVLIKANPLLGVGLGAYETALPQYSRSDGSLTVNAAHNDYLQVLADGGWVAGFAALWFVALVFRQVRRGLQSPDPLRAGLALGCGAAITGILAHSAFDFNLHLPAHALMFLILTAVVSELGSKVPHPVFQRVELPETQRGALAGATGSLRGTTL
jgi:O-antigen ligase